MESDTPLITFFAMGNIAHRTKELLGEYMRRRDRPLSADRQKYLTLTLHHIDHVREGFKITLRFFETSAWLVSRHLGLFLGE